MKGEQHLNNPEDFARVQARSKWIGDAQAGLKSCSNDLPRSRYGFIVSKRVGGAVVRNRVKRRMREIVSKMNLKPGADIVIIARPAAAEIDFGTLKNSIFNLMTRAGLLVTDDKEDCSGCH